MGLPAADQPVELTNGIGRQGDWADRRLIAAKPNHRRNLTDDGPASIEVFLIPGGEPEPDIFQRQQIPNANFLQLVLNQLRPLCEQQPVELGRRLDKVEEAGTASGRGFVVEYVGHGRAEHFLSHAGANRLSVPLYGIPPAFFTRRASEFASAPWCIDLRLGRDAFRVAVPALFADFGTTDPGVEGAVAPADISFVCHIAFWLL